MTFDRCADPRDELGIVVHRGGCIGHQRVCVLAIARTDCNADARGSFQFMAGHPHRRLEDLQHAVSESSCFRRIGDAFHQCKFVSAKPCEGVGRRNARLNTPEDFNQQQAARMMAECIVDPLEIVDAHKEESERGLLLNRATHGMTQVVFQQRAIGQASQGVMQCDVRKLPVCAYE